LHRIKAYMLRRFFVTLNLIIMLRNTEMLIKQVFDEVAKFVPDLSFITMQRDGAQVNFRMLANLMIENYPWPVGVELRRLFSINQLGTEQQAQLFKTLERTLQFVSFAMLSQVAEEKIKGRIEIPETFRTVFQERFEVLSLGDYIWLLRSLHTMAKKQKMEWFMAEIPEKFTDKFFEDLDFCAKKRNEMAHFQSNPSKSDLEMQCVILAEKVANVLTCNAFLVKYKLVYVKEIKVLKSKNQDARFHHNLDLLHSTHSDFTMEEFDDRKFTESNSVLLMKSDQSFDEYLNLSPLIIDTGSEVIDEERRFSIKKDIYLYSKFRNDKLSYTGTETTEICDLRLLHNYETLVGEFKEFMTTLS